jgi:transposase
MWQLPSRRGLARLLMTELAALGETERAFVVQLLADEPELAQAVAAARNLRRILCRESSRNLDTVLAAVERTALAGFASGLRRDAGAVQAALELRWTTSSGEGQISRIKMLERTMYGRAGFDLLCAASSMQRETATAARKVRENQFCSGGYSEWTTWEY